MVLSHAPAHPGDSGKPIASVTPSRTRRAADDALPQRAPFATRLKGQVDRYASTWLWIARDGKQHFGLRIALVVALNLLGLVAALAAVWGVMTYARHAQHDQPLRLLGMSLDLADGLRPLILFGAVIAGLGLISATCTYFTDRMVLAMARRYQTLCADRVLNIAADPLCRGWQAASDEPPRLIVSRLTGVSSRAMALTWRDMLRIILPVLTFLAAVAVMCVVNGRLTLWLVPLAAIYLVPLYLINRRVTRLQRQHREFSPIARGEASRRLRESLASGDLTDRIDEVKREVLNSPAAQGASAALYGRMLADRRVHLLNAAFFITCLVVLLVVFGSQKGDSGGESRRWADLIIYLLALRFAITSLRQATAFIAKFSRFYGETHRYERFVRLAEHSHARRAAMMANPAPLPALLTLRLGRHQRWSSPRTMSIPTRGMLWVLAPQPAGHADLEAVAVRMEQRLREKDIDLASNAAFIATRERIAATSAGIVFITDAIAETPTAQSAMGAIAEQALIIVVGSDPGAALQSSLGVRGERRMVVMDGPRFIAGGDETWLRANAREIAAYLTSQARPTLRGREAVEWASSEDDEGDE